MALIDLAAIRPFYLAPFAAAPTLVVRLLCVFRRVSVPRFGRFPWRGTDAFPLMLVVSTSTLLYGVAHDAQPQVLPVFRHRCGGGS